MSGEDLRKLVASEIARAGSLRALGKRWSVSAQHLCDIRLGRRTPGPKILRHLGLERVVDFSYRSTRRRHD